VINQSPLLLKFHKRWDIASTGCELANVYFGSKLRAQAILGHIAKQDSFAPRPRLWLGP
jgi:hypothetical protein